MGNMSTYNKKSISWGSIILMFFLFFPVGIFMLVKKMTTEKWNYANNGKSLQRLGWVLFGIGCIYIFTGSSLDFQGEDGRNAVEALIFLIILFNGSGLLCIFKGKKYVKLARKFSRYSSIVNANIDHSIDNIASEYPIDYETACKDLQYMLDIGYFPDSYLDLGGRELVTPQKWQQSGKVMFYESTPQTVQPKTMQPKTVQPRVVKCPNCGATNTLKPNAPNECEYCGSPL